MVVKVLLVGYHGLKNVGADARLEVLINILKRKYKDDISISYATLNNNQNLDAKAIKISFYNIFFKLFGEIRRTDVLIVDEGSPLRDCVGSAYLYFFLINIWYAKLFRKKIILYSVSVDKLKKFNYILTKFLLKKVNLITARTKRSYEILKSMKVKNLYLTSDCAISFPKKKVNKKMSDKKKIGLMIKEEFGFPVVFKLFGESKDKYLEHFFFTYSQINSLSQLNYLGGIVDYIDLKISEGYQIYLFDYEPQVDKNTNNQILARVKDKSKINYISATNYSPAQMKYFLSKMDYLITSRLHPFILSLEFQIPCIAIHRMSKLYGIFQDGGIDEYLMQYNEMRVCDKLNYLTRKIDKNRVSIKKKLEKMYENYVMLNTIQEKLLFDVLDK